jgi:phosphate transport system permease protein
MVAAVLAVLIPLIAVVWSVISRGAGVALREFPAFFTHDVPLVSRRAGPGMGPAIVGSVLVTGGATLIAVPLGVLGAIFLHEYGGRSPFARLVRFMATVMTGVPSIVMGLFVYLVWTLRFGYAAFGGSLALACLKTQPRLQLPRPQNSKALMMQISRPSTSKRC